MISHSAKLLYLTSAKGLTDGIAGSWKRSEIF